MSTASDTVPAPAPMPSTASEDPPSGSSPGLPSTSSSNANTEAGPSSSSTTTTSPPLSPPPPSAALSSTSSRPTTQFSSSSQTATGTSTASQRSPRTPTMATASTSTTPLNLINPHLPSQSTQLHVAEARAALVGSMSNLLDSELQSRAALLHQNAAALGRQEQDVARATEALRRENDKLAAVAREAGKRIKETGNVQNWAEVLERDFLVLEETLRRVREGSTGSEGGGSGSGSGSGSWWSGSEGSVSGEAPGEEEEADGAGRSGDGAGNRVEGHASGDVSSAMDVEMEPGEREGTFASVENSIARDIREAMETSVDDRGSPPPASALDEEAQGFGDSTDLVKAGEVDSYTAGSSEMNVDVGPESRPEPEGQGKGIVPGNVLDVLAFADTAASPATLKKTDAQTKPEEKDAAATTETDLEMDAEPEAEVKEVHRANVLDVLAFADTGLRPEIITTVEAPITHSGDDIEAATESKASARGNNEEVASHDMMDIDEPEVIRATPQSGKWEHKAQIEQDEHEISLASA